MAEQNDSLQKLKELVEGIDFAMLTTITPEGALHSRPMSTQEMESDGTLWFFTRANAKKVDEIEHEHQVNASYSRPENHCYVSVSGRATLVRDSAKIRKLWKPAYKLWFPEGLDDPELALLRVQIESAEFWDADQSRMLKLALMIKSLATGQEYEPGQHGNITLKDSAA
jgi:general stress protein 26